MPTSQASAFDISFTIVGMKFNVAFEEECFDENEIKEITSFVNDMSKEMHIDSTYVEKKGSKYTSTFMREDGWNALCDLIKDSQYGKYLHPKSQEILIDAVCTMGKCYIYECLSLLYDFQHIFIDVDTTKEFDVIFLKEEPNVWKRYTGKWQTWKDNKKDK